jgi:uncharacterized glyoxalase superfamily protein PhnB
MAGPYKPTGYTSVAPYLILNDAETTVAFLEQVLEGELLRRFDHPDGRIMHAEVRVDDTVVMMGNAPSGMATPEAHVHVYVPDVDAAYARALDAGATSVQEPMQKDDPDRRCGVRDPGGTTWWLGTMQG